MRAAAAIGALCMLLSPWLLWIEAPISGGARPGISLGWMAILLAGIAAVAHFRRSSVLAAVSGVMGLGLCSFAILHLTLLDPALWSLVDENAQYTRIMGFSRRYLPENLGTEPIFQADLATETVLERLAAAAYFMGFGWWMCLMGSVLLMIGCFALKGRRTLQGIAIAALAVCGGQGMLLGNGLVAQYLRDTGDRYLARGLYTEAIRRYEAAQRHDAQLAKSERTHLSLGEAYYHLGISAHPAARLYLGNRYAQQRNVEAALAQYLLATHDTIGSLGDIIRRRIAWTYVDLGLADYRKGEIGGASHWWEKSLTFDAAQLQAAYFLVRAYFDQGRYEQSITMGRFLVARSQNQLVNADVQANIGDGYWKLHDFTKARLAYEASMRLDSFANFRIFRSLGGT